MIIFILLVSILSYHYGSSSDCSRSQSRIVRNVFVQKIESEFVRLSASLPADCPFNVERDVYGKQEQFKKMESVGRWSCLFCGKSFYDEVYLDKHFDRKHSNKIPQGDRGLCLADYCDFFRCDILTGRVVAQYWDKALCKEDELSVLMDKCQDILGSCVSRELSQAHQSQLFDFMNKTICFYLTCSQYWNLPDDETSPVYTALYITAGVFFLFGSLIYYAVAYSHFYTDESLLDGPRRQSRPYARQGRVVARDGTIRYRPNADRQNDVW